MFIKPPTVSSKYDSSNSLSTIPHMNISLSVLALRSRRKQGLCWHLSIRQTVISVITNSRKAKNPRIKRNPRFFMIEWDSYPISIYRCGILSSSSVVKRLPLYSADSSRSNTKLVIELEGKASKFIRAAILE